jgi:hypothetical protein
VQRGDVLDAVTMLRREHAEKEEAWVKELTAIEDYFHSGGRY